MVLTGDRYRELMAQALGVDLTRTLITVKLVRYDPGSWIGPHTDVMATVASHIIQLNLYWKAEWGGGLRLLPPSHSHEVAHTVLPDHRTSIAFLRSNISWHEVQPIVEGAPVSRTTLVVHLHK
ncbi:MAG: 2OG-Fe(II) oxygenase [Mycobacteriales bacterium]